MDAQLLKVKVRSRHVGRPRARLVVAWLAAVLAVGLWQGYGKWLLTGGAGDAF